MSTRVIAFTNSLGVPIADFICRGLVSCEITGDNHGQLARITLVNKDDSVAVVRPDVVTVGYQDEIGVLDFSERGGAEESKRRVIDLTGPWQMTLLLDYLVIEEPGLFVECGLSIENNLKEKILVVPGTMPFTIELSAPFYNGPFDPECALEAYKSKRVVRES